MSSADVAIRRGDLVLIQPETGMTGIRRGLYVVLDAGPGGLSVTPATLTVNGEPLLEQLVVDPAHVASWWRAGSFGTSTLPASRLDVATSRETQPATLPPAPQRPTSPLVRVRITNPRTRYHFTIPVPGTRRAEDVFYEPLEHGHDVIGQPTAVFVMERDHVTRIEQERGGTGALKYGIELLADAVPVESFETASGEAPRVRVARR